MTKNGKRLDHLLSFVTNESGDMLTVHADLAGVERLISELEGIRDLLLENDCPHTHLFSKRAAGYELTETKLQSQPVEKQIVHHVKIYGWNDEWAKKHGLLEKD